MSGTVESGVVGGAGAGGSGGRDEERRGGDEIVARGDVEMGGEKDSSEEEGNDGDAVHEGIFTRNEWEDDAKYKDVIPSEMDVHQQDLRFFKRPKNPYHSVAVPRRKRRTEGCAKTEEFYRINEVTSKQRKHDADPGNNIVATGQSAREVAEDLDIPKSTVFITSGYNPSASVAAKGTL